MFDQIDYSGKFFSALKSAVSAICGNKGCFQVQPKQGVQLEEVLKSPNVYKCIDTDYKLFDTDCGTKINDELINNILGNDYFCEMKTIS